MKVSLNQWKYLSVVSGGLAVLSLIISVVYLQFATKASAATPQAIVKITDDGFLPATITVKAGTVLTWQNVDGQPHRVVSGPYPAHTDLPGLDSVQNMSTGQYYQFTAAHTGTFTYYDAAHPSSAGQIVVK